MRIHRIAPLAVGRVGGLLLTISYAVVVAADRALSLGWLPLPAAPGSALLSFVLSLVGSFAAAYVGLAILAVAFNAIASFSGGIPVHFRLDKSTAGNAVGDSP